MSVVDWKIISEKDLVDPQKSDGHLRSYCHCHHDNRSPSLSINPDNGFGRCFRCGDQVLVRELNPDAAENIEQSRGHNPIRVRDPKYVAAEREAKEARIHQVAEWKKEELRLLSRSHARMIARLEDDRARAYLAQRGIPLESARCHGMGYIPLQMFPDEYRLLNRWADRIIFPVKDASSGDIHYAGRSLRLWQPGMDEDEHKAILDAKETEYNALAKEARDKGQEAEEKRWKRQASNHRRYLKTYRTGWFNYQALEGATVTICEGAFDALALVEAGYRDAIAVIGTAISVDAIPRHLSHITLAFDGDVSGRERSAELRRRLYLRGFNVSTCAVPDDSMGKDWSERYRLHGREGLAPLLEASLDTCACGLSVFADPDLGSYDEDGQYHCSEHPQEQQGEKSVRG